MAVIVTMEESPLLIAMNRCVRPVKIQYQNRWWAAMRGDELLDQLQVHRQGTLTALGVSKRDKVGALANASSLPTAI